MKFEDRDFHHGCALPSNDATRRRPRRRHRHAHQPCRVERQRRLRLRRRRLLLGCWRPAFFLRRRRRRRVRVNAKVPRDLRAALEALALR